MELQWPCVSMWGCARLLDWETSTARRLTRGLAASDVAGAATISARPRRCFVQIVLCRSRFLPFPPSACRCVFAAFQDTVAPGWNHSLESDIGRTAAWYASAYAVAWVSAVGDAAVAAVAAAAAAVAVAAAAACTAVDSTPRAVVAMVPMVGALLRTEVIEHIAVADVECVLGHADIVFPANIAGHTERDIAAIDMLHFVAAVAGELAAAVVVAVVIAAAAAAAAERIDMSVLQAIGHIARSSHYLDNGPLLECHSAWAYHWYPAADVAAETDGSHSQRFRPASGSCCSCNSS
jgi:hypothetical protein